jgi:hypothetical protein
VIPLEDSGLEQNVPVRLPLTGVEADYDSLSGDGFAVELLSLVLLSLRMTLE